MNDYVSFKYTFEDAAENVKNLPQKPNDDEMLKLYGLYKQATLGDCNTERPGFWSPVNRAKWDSWNGYRNWTCDKAKEDYVKLVEFLTLKYK
jgi:diazepam-binding inhibitor (GABA receptor modulating acyl-CoA-binding protein)